MDIQKNSFLSIDQLANQYLNNSRKTVKAAQEIWYHSRKSYRAKVTSN